MKHPFEYFINKPTTRIAIAGTGGAAAGAAYSWISGAEWYVFLLTAGGGVLAQWLELRWTHHRMRLLLKARRRTRIAQIKRQA
jgi:hypothetical protein